MDFWAPEPIISTVSVGFHWEIKSSYHYRLEGIFAIFSAPPGPHDFPGKSAKSFVQVIFPW